MREPKVAPENRQVLAVSTSNRTDPAPIDHPATEPPLDRGNAGTARLEGSRVARRDPEARHSHPANTCGTSRTVYSLGVATIQRPWVGWALWLAAMLPAAAGLLLLAGSLDAPIPDSYGFRGFSALFALSFGSVGAFVVARRPGNLVGITLLAIGILAGVLAFLLEYANVGLIAAPGTLPGALWAAWIASWSWVPIVILAGPILLSIYPDGRFISTRWRSLALVGVGFGLMTILLTAFREGPLENFRSVGNPLGILPRATADSFAILVSLGLPVVLAASVLSLVPRFRAADRDARQQIKWFAIAALALGVAGPFGFSAGKLGSVLFILALCTVPLATGMAVLRYGLYEIDTVINRAIVYGLLSALLAGLYTASIGVMQRVSKAFTGGDSEAALVLTTLLVVTAFTPVKTRVQTLVDRRFKENRDPAARLGVFVGDLRASFAPPDARRTLRRFLEVVVDACELQGGRIQLDGPGAVSWSAETGAPPGPVASAIGPVPLGSATLRLVLGRTKRRAELSARHRSAVQEALMAAIGELDRPGQAER